MKKWRIAVATVAIMISVWSAARADEAPPPQVQLAGTVALVSQYNSRGLSLSDHDFALQGSVTASGRKGLSGGLWASTIDSTAGSEVEIDIFASKTFDFKGASFSLGGLGYVYPGGKDLAYGEATLTASKPIGPVDLTVGANYAPEQGNTGGLDNLYIYTNAAAPLGKVFKTPLTLAASFGYESGPLALRADKLDWSLRVTASRFGFDVSLAYLDSNLDLPVGKATALFSISHSF